MTHGGRPSARRAKAIRDADPEVLVARQRWRHEIRYLAAARIRCDLALAIDTVLRHPELSDDLLRLMKTVRHRREAGDWLPLWEIADRLGHEDLSDQIWDAWISGDEPPRAGLMSWVRQYLVAEDADAVTVG